VPRVEEGLFDRVGGESTGGGVGGRGFLVAAEAAQQGATARLRATTGVGVSA
jgi:hypothetical protein